MIKYKRNSHRLLFGLLITSLLISCHKNHPNMVAIQPLGEFEHELTQHVAKSINDVYGFKVSILPEREIPQSTFINQKSPRYRADKLIKLLKEEKPDSVDYIIGLLNKDISTTKKDKWGNTLKPTYKYEDWGIFGLGYRPGVSSVVSTYRIKNTTPIKFEERLAKISVHELGHNLGLKHCHDKNCVMTDAVESIKTVDNANLELCKSCLKELD